MFQVHGTNYRRVIRSVTVSCQDALPYDQQPRQITVVASHALDRMSCTEAGRDRVSVAQKNILEGLGLGAGGSIQVDFKGANGRPVRSATVKAKGNETETLPLYTNKDTVTGEVRLQHQTDSARK